MRAESQPASVGCDEKPKPGIDGMTTSNASSLLPPCAVGSVSGPITSSISITEPGQPCVMISGRAPSCSDLTWMKWMSSPSMFVMY
jgi:hypothetical protein